MPISPGKKSRWLGLPKRVALGFALALASLLASGILTGFTLGKRTDASERAEAAADTHLALVRVESALLVAEAALGAFVHGGEARHRAELESAHLTISQALGHLSRAIATEGIEDAELHLGQLRPTVKRLVEVQRRVRALADAGELEEARALHAARGLPAFQRARARLEAIHDLEHREAAAALSWARQARAISNGVFLALDLVLLVLLLGAARVVRQEIRAREAHEGELAQAQEVQQRLVAVVSHDLRNPLSGILTAAWALQRMELPEEPKRAARRIASAGRRMERLIRDLLDWSRAKAGAEIPILLREADLYDVCARVADDLCDARNARVQLSRAGDTRAEFDPDRMEQVVGNLVSNALKYGDPERPVRVEAVGEERSVRVEVRNDGPALDAAVIASLFEPFHRAPRGHPASGSSVGLGLFVVRTLSEAQGAEVDVRSTPGEGTTFVVRVRRSLAAPPEAQAG